MYTIQNAATALGVSVSTVRRWISQSNIEKTVLETDRKRVYIAYSDVLALADKHKPLIANAAGLKESSQDMNGLYSIEEAARLLGAAYETVRKWIVSSDIDKKIVITDRKRAYISYADIVLLAEKYNCTISYDNVMTGQDSHAQEDSPSQEDKFYSVADAALFLGVPADTVRYWLSLYNIEKKTLDTDRRRIYIAYRDIIMLASKQRHKNVYPVDIATNIREIRGRLEKIEAGILNLEQYIKRSIYLGS